MKKVIKLCLIGTGRAGMIHARNYRGCVPNAQLIALCDPLQENLDQAQAELQVPYLYHDYQEALKNPDIDAVIVVTPTNLHKAIVVAAAHAKKHVFCEKPMAISVAECDEMIHACQKNGVKLQIGFMRRFDEGFRHGKSLIESAEIGEVTLIKSLTHGPSQPKAWMYDIANSGGPIAEVNSHDLDTLRWYAGSEVKAIHAIGHNFRSPEVVSTYPDYYDTVAILLEFHNGIIGMIDGAQYVQYGYDARAEILGTKGNVLIGSQRNDNVCVALHDRKLQCNAMPSWTKLFKDAYVNEAKAFIQAIMEDTEPEVSGYDGKMALILVQAGNQSLKEGRCILLGGEQ